MKNLPRTILNIVMGVSFVLAFLMVAEGMARDYLRSPGAPYSQTERTGDAAWLPPPSAVPDLENLGPKTRGEIRILCLGASNVMPTRGALGPDSDDGFSGPMKVLAPQYRIINAGVAGYTSWQTLQFYRVLRTRFPLQPDVVFFHEVFNDAMAAPCTDLQGRAEADRVNQARNSPSSLVSLLKLWTIPPLNVSPLDTRRVPPGEYIENLRELSSLCRQDGATQFWVLILPPGELVHAQGYFTALLGSGLPVIDLRNRTLAGEANPDGIHFTYAGYSEIARELVQKISPRHK